MLAVSIQAWGCSFRSSHSRLGFASLSSAPSVQSVADHPWGLSEGKKVGACSLSSTLEA